MKFQYKKPITEITIAEKSYLLSGSGKIDENTSGEIAPNRPGGINGGPSNRPNAKGNTFDVWDDGDEDEE